MIEFRPAFLVDGYMEKLALQKICPDRPIRRLECNGRDVSAAAIAKRAETQIKLLSKRCFQFIIIVDLEERKVSAQEFARSVIKEIRSLGVKEALIIGVPDRMIENWLYCDSAIVGKKARACDGEHGCALIESAVPNYHKTTSGPELLARCRASEIKKKSPSFADFHKQLNPKVCPWLGR